MEQKLIDAITEIVDEGIICVDAGGIVTRFSRKAKEMTGVVLQGGRSHPAGCIRPGDLVLIADNMLGDDDGGMTPEDLALILMDERGSHRGVQGRYYRVVLNQADGEKELKAAEMILKLLPVTMQKGCAVTAYRK